LSLKTFVAKPRGDRLTLGSAILAHHNGGLPSVSPGPTFNASGCVALGSGNEPRIRVKFFVSTHINEHWRAGKPHKTGKLRDGDFGWRGHGGVHLE
jgi:hypothetical protein